MVETLLVWFNRLTDDPSKLVARLANRPVLMYEPHFDLDDEEAPNYQLLTQSGLSIPSVGGGEPLVVVVEKTKANAFQRRITIGRTGNNDIVLDEASVSRFHAWLEQVGQEWVVVDAGSRNGTTLAGRKLLAKVPTPLVNGQALRIGSMSLTYYTSTGFLDLLRRKGSSGD